VVETPVDRLDTARLKNLKKVADGAGISFRFQHLSQDETIARVKTRLEREGFSIEPDALDLLLDSVGTQLIDLANELDKIMLSSGDTTTITRDTVAAVVGKYRTENLFGFLDRIGKSDQRDIVYRLNRVLDGGEEPVFVLAMLLRRVLQLLYVNLLFGERGGRATAKAKTGLGVSPYQASMLVDQAKHLRTGDLEIYLRNLRWADTKIKTSAARPHSLLETALVASYAGKTLAP
jgi:DNA polymerase-3 subunit delta